jgi:hypothetical protein
MRKYNGHFSSLLDTCTWGVVVPSATPDFAATMLNLIGAEVSVTAGWLPSGHVL